MSNRPGSKLLKFGASMMSCLRLSFLLSVVILTHLSNLLPPCDCCLCNQYFGVITFLFHRLRF